MTPRLPFLATERAVSPLRVLGCVALYAVALFALTAPMRAWVDRHERLRFDDGIWAKQALGSYTADPTAFDGVFVGSSRVARGIIPRRFDDAMAKLGHATHTLNLGRPGTNFVEMASLLRRLARWGDGALRFVVVELPELDPKFHDENRRTPRAAGWHTPRATRDMLAILWASERPLTSKITESFGHLVEFAEYLGSVGMVERISKVGRESVRANLRGRVAGARGYNRVKPDASLPPDELPELLALQEVRPGRPTHLNETQRRLLLELDRDLRDAGLQPIYVRMPGFHRAGAELDAIRQGVLAPFVDAYALDSCRDLFDTRFFRDTDHLNHEGAQRFSTALAQALAPLLPTD